MVRILHYTQFNEVYNLFEPVLHFLIENGQIETTTFPEKKLEHLSSNLIFSTFSDTARAPTGVRLYGTYPTRSLSLRRNCSGCGFQEI